MSYIEEEKKENSSNSKEINKIEKYQYIYTQLRELKNLIKGGQPVDINKINILEYVLYPELISIDELKNKIYAIFKVKNNEELYLYLLEEINSLFKKDKPIKSSLEEISLRGQFYKILENLNCFISYSLIYFINNNENKALEYFNKWILFDNKTTKSILYSYINIFNLKDILFDFFSIKREILFSIPDNIRILYIISILKLQNIFPYKNIIKERNKNYFEQNLCVYELYNTYNSTLKDLYNLTDYLMSYNLNWVQPTTIEKIINDIEIINKIDDNIRNILIEKLMINYSLKKEKEKNKEKEILSYYRIISNNITLLSTNYYINWNEINEIFKYYIEKKEYDKSISLLNSIKNIDIINNYISDNLIYTLATSIPIGKIGLISFIIKTNKNLINYLLNSNTIKDGLKLIKILQLNNNEYDSLYDEISLNNFFQYKINLCIEDSFDILIDYGLINEDVYNKLIYKLMKKTYQYNSNNINNSFENDNSIALNEDDDEKINESEQENDISEKNNFSKLNEFFIKESKETNIKSLNKKLTKDILTQKDKEKILSLYHFGNMKNYNLTNNNQNLFDKIFNDISLININYFKYIPEDKYEPHDLSCLSIDIKNQKITFIDNIKSLNDNYKYFKKSKYIGIDSEWKQPFNANNKENASILQLSNYSEKNVMIIDLLKMKNDEQFFNFFEQCFKNKIFIGYAFNKSDIEQFNGKLQKMFKKADIIDLIDIYQLKYLKKAGSLKDMCQEFLGAKLCKYEQCSNWENRPLKKRQLHYAALDAIVCITLYKKMTDVEFFRKKI